MNKPEQLSGVNQNIDELGLALPHVQDPPLNEAAFFRYNHSSLLALIDIVLMLLFISLTIFEFLKNLQPGSPVIGTVPLMGIICYCTKRNYLALKFVKFMQ